MPRSLNELGSYREFLQTFIKQGYRFVFFDEQDRPENQLILRHDIDFDIGLALEMAKMEAEMGIKATFFFLLRSNMYNLLSPDSYEKVMKIRALGHRISLHYDPTIYEDFHRGLEEEAEMFEKFFGTPVDIISFHRPNEFYQAFDQPICGIEHTYLSKYFRHIKYISDSTGVWRYGHPFDFPEFLSCKSMHLLIHPIWWILEANSNYDKLRVYFEQRVESLKEEFSKNSIPFRYIHESL